MKLNGIYCYDKKRKNLVDTAREIKMEIVNKQIMREKLYGQIMPGQNLFK